MEDYNIVRQTKTEELVRNLTNYVNTYSFADISAEFNKQMSCQHRTLQNSFSRLCLQWLEHIASEEYGTDPRNASSAEISKRLLTLFKEQMIKENWTGPTLEMMAKPSNYCNFI